jgi:Pyruvate/2-oxoacid:ferredoxin oxidoreductase gamma subunit
MQVIRIEGSGSFSLTGLAAKACFLSGFHVQSFSNNNCAFVKFDKDPITSKQEEFSDYLVIADKKTDLKAALRNAKEKSVLVINSAEKPKLPDLKKRKIKTFIIDVDLAAGSTKSDGSCIMLGALSKACERITSKGARAALGESREDHIVFEEGFRTAKMVH